MLNTSLLEEIRERHSTSKCFGTLFKKFGPVLRAYSAYVDNHDSASKLLRRLREEAQFQAFCASVEMDARSRGQQLESFLIMPVQRVPRYQLLLKELLKHTDASHPDHGDLSEALDLVAETAMHINESIRQRENSDKIREIQEREKVELLAPARIFLREGVLRKVCRRGPKEFNFYLFSDLLMYCGDGLAGRTNRMIDLSAAGTTCEVKPWTAGTGGPETDAFLLQSKAKSFWVLGLGTQRAADWATEVKNCIAALKRRRSTAFGGAGEIEDGDGPVAAVWEPDSATKNCQRCNTAFGLLTRRHHCRNCGAVVCGSCSNHKFRLEHIDDRALQRVCFQCYTQLQASTRYAPAHRMAGPLGKVSATRGGVQSASAAGGINPGFDPIGRRDSALARARVGVASAQTVPVSRKRSTASSLGSVVSEAGGATPPPLPSRAAKPSRSGSVGKESDGAAATPPALPSRSTKPAVSTGPALPSRASGGASAEVTHKATAAARSEPTSTAAPALPAKRPAVAATANAPVLRQGWSAVVVGGKTLYVCDETGEKREEPVLPLKPGWAEARADDGDIYYYHTVTDETTWDAPLATVPKKKPPPPPRAAAASTSLSPSAAAAASAVPAAQPGSATAIVAARAARRRSSATATTSAASAASAAAAAAAKAAASKTSPAAAAAEHASPAPVSASKPESVAERIARLNRAKAAPSRVPVSRASESPSVAAAARASQRRRSLVSGGESSGAAAAAAAATASASASPGAAPAGGSVAAQVAALASKRAVTAAKAEQETAQAGRAVLRKSMQLQPEAAVATPAPVVKPKPRVKVKKAKKVVEPKRSIATAKGPKVMVAYQGGAGVAKTPAAAPGVSGGQPTAKPVRTVQPAAPAPAPVPTRSASTASSTRDPDACGEFSPNVFKKERCANCGKNVAVH